MPGQYVRIIWAPRTHFGTITATRWEEGGDEYLFHHDQRFADKLPDFWVLSSEIEPCARPTDSQVAEINRLLK
jgi:hypothetical protein